MLTVVCRHAYRHARARAGQLEAVHRGLDLLVEADLEHQQGRGEHRPGAAGAGPDHDRHRCLADAELRLGRRRAAHVPRVRRRSRGADCRLRQGRQPPEEALLLEDQELVGRVVGRAGLLPHHGGRCRLRPRHGRRPLQVLRCGPPSRSPSPAVPLRSPICPEVPVLSLSPGSPLPPSRIDHASWEAVRNSEDSGRGISLLCFFEKKPIRRYIYR
eukprot:65694-Prymnesium_polylepis.1